VTLAPWENEVSTDPRAKLVQAAIEEKPDPKDLSELLDQLDQLANQEHLEPWETVARSDSEDKLDYPVSPVHKEM